PLPADTAIIGEVGLSGEVRTVNQLGMRLNEAAKIGFKRVLMPKVRRKLEDAPKGLQLLQVRNIAEAMDAVLPKD
ncbi:MAG: DNA repair protein RadA, partial [Anaerolineae bacterium]|nr:DNA repair protein RadA [Anaerolineae bacterium]